MIVQGVSFQQENLRSERAVRQLVIKAEGDNPRLRGQKGPTGVQVLAGMRRIAGDEGGAERANASGFVGTG